MTWEVSLLQVYLGLNTILYNSRFFQGICSNSITPAGFFGTRTSSCCWLNFFRSSQLRQRCSTLKFATGLRLCFTQLYVTTELSLSLYGCQSIWNSSLDSCSESLTIQVSVLGYQRNGQGENGTEQGLRRNRDVLLRWSPYRTHGRDCTFNQCQYSGGDRADKRANVWPDQFRIDQH